MYLKHFFFILFFGVANISLAQNDANEMYSYARNYMDYEQYDKALELFLELDSSVLKDNNDVKYHIGLCYIRSGMEEKALSYLQYAINTNYETAEDFTIFKNELGIWVSHDIDFNLGKAYQFNEQFDSAIVHYLKFEEKIPTTFRKRDEEIGTIDKLVQECKNGQFLLTHKRKDVKVYNLGNIVNTEFSEYFPIIDGASSTIYYTTRRPDNVGGLKDEYVDNQYYEDVVLSHKVNGKWTEVEHLSGDVNTNYHEATTAISADGKNIYISKTDPQTDGDFYRCELNESHWELKEKLPSQINSKSWESSMSISPDGNKIFFTSDREGSYGGTDIFYVEKNNNGTWSNAINMGPSINTPFDEECPFMHFDGKTLYFSSKGHFNIGGFDIFKSEYDAGTNTWSKAENMGMPVNSASDDMHFVLTKDRKQGFFSAHRADGYGLHDIYGIRF